MESDVSAIRARIDVIEHRLTALADRGADTAGLSDQLVHARDLLETGDADAALEITHGVASGVRQLATGDARSSGEVRLAAREHLVGEVREALVGGAADGVITTRIEQIRVEMAQRMEEFERRLRDQFARELAQLVGSRPWMKDVLGQSGDESSVRRMVQSILEQQPAVTVGEGSAALRSGVATLREQVSGLRKRVEAGGTEPDGIEAFEDRFWRTISEITSSAEGVAEMVANVADAHAQMSDRLLALERRLAAQTAPIAETGITSLHVAVGDESRSGSATIATESGGQVAVEKRASLADTEIPPEAAAVAGAQPLTDSAQGSRHGAGTRPVESQAWPFGEESSAAKPAVSQSEIDALLAAATASSEPSTGVANTAMPQPIVGGSNGGSSGGRALIGRGDQGATGTERPGPQPMTDRSVSIQRASTDEATVRRLIEERLAAWKPSPGDGLVQDEDELVTQLARLFPQILDDGRVRMALFATIALESIERPGALAHVTQLRKFLRSELALAVEQLQADSIPHG